MKYVYPAIFTPEGEKAYLVNFPDLENCFTDGEDLYEAIENAQDVLALILCGREDYKVRIPPAHIQETPKDVPEGAIVTLISCDTTEYRKKLKEERIKE